jgi:hypothetical protein
VLSDEFTNRAWGQNIQASSEINTLKKTTMNEGGEEDNALVRHNKVDLSQT